MKRSVRLLLSLSILLLALPLKAQVYQNGLIDKTIAVIGGEMISLSELEQEIQIMRAQGMGSDRNMRCELLEQMMEAKLFLVQARIDSLTVNQDMVEGQLTQRFDQIRTRLGGDEGVEAYFGKPIHRLRQEWRSTLEEQALTQQEQSEIAGSIAEITPYDVQKYIEETPAEDLPEVPIRYQLSQICLYPDREAAALAAKERLLDIRERIINGEKFATLARIYSEDPGSARRGGELGMASRSIFWPAFSDAAMSLKPGVISQIVETPDGFHLIEVLEKKGDMFNARHILIKPFYTSEDSQKAYATLDSLKREIAAEAVTFKMAAEFYSEDPASRTNGGQMADPYSGSTYFEIDLLKPQDYNAIKGLSEGEITEPFESVDDEGRGNVVYKMIRVDKILPAHVASYENDYSQLIETVRGKKQTEAIDAFVKKKIQSTHIVIDPLFGGCEFTRPEWADKVRKP